MASWFPRYLSTLAQSLCQLLLIESDTSQNQIHRQSLESVRDCRQLQGYYADGRLPTECERSGSHEANGFNFAKQGK